MQTTVFGQTCYCGCTEMTRVHAEVSSGHRECWSQGCGIDGAKNLMLCTNQQFIARVHAPSVSEVDNKASQS